MKKSLLVFLLVILLSGCTNPFINNAPAQPVQSTEFLLEYASPLSINDAAQAIQENGLTLSTTKSIDPSDFTFDGITPVVYEINKSGHYLLIYDYKKIGRLKDAGSSWYYSSVLFHDRYYPDTESWYSRPFMTKNLLLVFRINKDLWAKNNNIEDIFKSFSNAIYDLNKGVTFTYTDQSENFDARVKVSGFWYWYKDDKGCNYLEQDSQQKWEVRYLGPDPESIHDLHYWINTSGGFGSSSSSMHRGNILEKENNQYYLRLDDNDHRCPDKDTVYTLKIKLNNQKVETLALRNIQPTLAIFMNESFNAAFMESLD